MPLGNDMNDVGDIPVAAVAPIGKDDEDSEDSPSRKEAAQRSTFVSVLVNLLLTASQVTAGLVSGSQGLVADGIHSLSDLVADFVVLLANHHSSREPDEDHHYGHQRYENAASLTLGLLLLAVGAGMLWAALGKIEHPDSIPQVGTIALWVALGALAAKEMLFRYMLRIAERVRSGMLVANAWHARSDAASSLVVAIGIGGNLLGYRMLDPIAAMIVGLFITKMGWSFGRTALEDLMDRAVAEERVETIRETVLATPGVLGHHKLRTRKMGDMILVDVHLEVNADMSVEQGHDIAFEVRRRIMELDDVLDVMTHVDPVHPENPAPQ